MSSGTSAYELPGPPRDLTIVAVDIAGITDPGLVTTLRGVIKTRPTDQLGTAPIAEDLRQLWGLGMISDARVDIRGVHGGVALTYELAPQPLIDHVTVVGERRDALPLRRLRWLEGTPYEPDRIVRVAESIRSAYIHDGHLDAKVDPRRVARPGVALCVAVDPGPRVTIGSLRFVGNGAVPVRKLLHAVGNAETGVNRVGGLYDREALEAAVSRIEAEYYELGRVQVHVDLPRATRHGDRLDIEIAIRQGPEFHVGWIGLAIPGAERIPLRVHTGDLFQRSKLAAEVARLEGVVGPGATITPETTIDAATARIAVTLRVDWRWPWHALRWLSSH